MWTVPEKTTGAGGEGVRGGVGECGQYSLHTTALNAVLLREYGVFI